MSQADRYLLDTNVISEVRKSQPNSRVRGFLAQTDTRLLFLSVLTIGELRRGAEKPRLNDPEYSRTLHEWVDYIESIYKEQILPIDITTARIWGELSATRSRPIVDTLLASTSMAHGLIFVTRNVIDVRGLPLRIVNPWDS